MSQRPMFPLWLRAWHGVNAALFLVLAGTGFSLHFAGAGVPALPFRGAVAMHNAAGILLVANYLFYAALLIRTGGWRQYVPRVRELPAGIVAQVRFYLGGIFRGEHHPFAATPERRFNPMQQVTYLVHMFLLFPLLALTGVFLLFPGAAPERVAQLGGVWPMAVAHTLLAFAFVAFLTVHVYLALTASEPQSGIRAMLLGDRNLQPQRSRRAPEGWMSQSPPLPQPASPAGSRSRRPRRDTASRRSK